MFDSDVSQDEGAKKVTRRAFVAGSLVVAAACSALKLQGPSGVEASTEVHGSPGETTVVMFSDDGTNLGSVRVAKVVKADGAWYRQLGGNSFGIARQADTEMAYSGVTWKEHGRGVYRCLCCETALFDSRTKFESGTGWPSFWAPIARENILKREDRSLGALRTEVACTRCEAHLGHVFSDGPEPTGLRYCMNSAAMRFAKA